MQAQDRTELLIQRPGPVPACRGLMTNPRRSRRERVWQGLARFVTRFFINPAMIGEGKCCEPSVLR